MLRYPLWHLSLVQLEFYRVYAPYTLEQMSWYRGLMLRTTNMLLILPHPCLEDIPMHKWSVANRFSSDHACKQQTCEHTILLSSIVVALLTWFVLKGATVSVVIVRVEYTIVCRKFPLKLPAVKDTHTQFVALTNKLAATPIEHTSLGETSSVKALYKRA
jgi:hypothetical protein